MSYSVSLGYSSMIFLKVAPSRNICKTIEKLKKPNERFSELLKKKEIDDEQYHYSFLF